MSPFLSFRGCFFVSPRSQSGRLGCPGSCWQVGTSRASSHAGAGSQIQFGRPGMLAALGGRAGGSWLLSVLWCQQLWAGVWPPGPAPLVGCGSRRTEGRCLVLVCHRRRCWVVRVQLVLRWAAWFPGYHCFQVWLSSQSRCCSFWGWGLTPQTPAATAGGGLGSLCCCCCCQGGAQLCGCQRACFNILLMHSVLTATDD